MKRLLPLFLLVSGALADDVKPPPGFREVGGSNVVMFDVGDGYLNDGEGWFEPGMMQPVVGTFHLQEKAAVQQQLKAMVDSGQRKISILVWHDHLSPEEYGNTGVYGHVIDSAGGALEPQHAENLKGLLALVRNAGFNELIFRFAQQGDA